MWILLKQKIRGVASPPALSIFWATPWPGEIGAKQLIHALMCDFYGENYEREHDHRMAKIRKRNERLAIEKMEKAISDGEYTPPDFASDQVYYYSRDIWGHEPNFIGAVKIRYKNENLRVFPHEFSRLPDDRLKRYIESTHDLQLSDTPESEALQLDIELNPDKIELYWAALLEGASPNEAKAYAAGILTPIDDGTEIKPVGWYRVKKDFGRLLFPDAELQ